MLVHAGESIRTSWLVGCDGGRSSIRKQAGFSFEGSDPTIVGHQAIATLDHPERLLPLGWRRTPHGMLAFGPIPNRMVTVEFDGPPTAPRDSAVTAQEIEASLRRVSGADVRVLALEQATRWTDHARLVDSYRRGRVLLAGDAAHVHSPFSGQGLALGLLDATNLGWKLAAVIGQRLPEALLDTYTAERRPVAERALASTRAQVALMRPDAQTGALRELVTELMDTDEGNRFFGELTSGVRTRYDLGDDSPAVGRLTANDEVLVAAMRGGQGVVLTSSAADLEIARDYQVQTAPSAEARFVRPDGIVAWAGGEPSTLRAALERWAPCRADA